MYCKHCGYENEDSAKYCKNCGENLNFYSNFKRINTPTQTYNNNSSKNRNLLIICITIIIIALIIAGAFLLTSNNTPPETSQNVPSTTTENTNTEVTTASNPLKIISGHFYTASLPAKTYITVYVGEQHAGENVKIRVFYSHGGTRLNAGNIVPKTVDSKGYFTMRTANTLNSYPDYAEITLYDGNGNIVDSENVNMHPTMGTQYF